MYSCSNLEHHFTLFFGTLPVRVKTTAIYNVTSIRFVISISIRIPTILLVL